MTKQLSHKNRYSRSSYHRRKEQGLCPRCGSEREDTSLSYCRSCLDKQNAERDKNRQKHREYMQRWYSTIQGQELRLSKLSKRRLEPVDETRPESYVQCTICGEKFRQITSTHLKLHGLTTTEYKGHGHPLMCQEKLDRNAEVLKARSEQQQGENHPAWKGGHKSKLSGYRYIYRNGKPMYEHRAIMEDVLQRPLQSNEQVHHIDGNRANNDPSNLMILSAPDHTRITAKRSYASWRRLGVVAIRSMLSRGWSLDEISSEFNITTETILIQLRKHPDTLQEPPVSASDNATR